MSLQIGQMLVWEQPSDGEDVKPKFEVPIVLALSLGKSAIYALLSLIVTLTTVKGLAGSKVTINQSADTREWLDLSLHLLGFAFSLAPVALALYLLSLDSKPFTKIGFTLRPFWKNVRDGLGLAALIGIPGIGLYLGARALGLSAQIQTTSLNDYWWTIPVLLLSAVSAALVEEVIVVGYLFERLERLKFRKWTIILSAAALRGSYHLYQGFGGFVGNFAMGVVFGYLYKKYGRLTPLVIAHFVLDAVSFVGYSFAKQYLPI